MHKIKTIQIFCNGSTHFFYKTSNNFKLVYFLEKDNKNFDLNMKNKNDKVDSKTFSNYKNKYLINK